MKIIWDSQNEAPLYALNEEGLHNILRTKTRKFKRVIWWQEWLSYGSTLFVLAVIVFFLTFGFLSHLGLVNEIPNVGLWDALALLCAAACWVKFAFNIYSGKKQQLEREQKYSSSLLDDLDRDIDQANYQIDKRKHMIKVFMPPYVGALLFLLVMFRVSGDSEWLIVPAIGVMIVAMAFEIWTQKRLIRRKIQPHKQELEILRNKLTNPEN
ncbi:MAG: hypothetical protein O3C20_08045 [Verrucomicrobia bacterium]|nr:hypothetical protein [Verrucomicrobiota bacterium]